VGLYPTNKLIRRELVPNRRPKLPFHFGPKTEVAIRY
jgi:hypothetical protein